MSPTERPRSRDGDGSAQPASAPRRRLEHDERRNQILRTAMRLFCQRPYAEVGMADLAEAAGVTRGLLHHYFGGKRDLYLAVVRSMARVPAMPLPEAAAGLPAEVVWEGSVDAWMALIEASHEVWLAVINAGGTGRDAELEAILNDAREEVCHRSLDALRVPPDDRTLEVMAVVRGFGAFAEELTREWLERRRLTRAQTRAALIRALPLLLDGVLADVMDAGT